MNVKLSDELANIDCCDKRLNQRAIQIMEGLENNTGRGFSGSFQNRAELTGALRFVDNPRVSPKDILKPHIEKTIERMGEHPIVIVPSDSSELNFSHMEEVEGLSATSHNVSVGQVVHTMLAMTPSRIPLGMLDFNFLPSRNISEKKKHRNCRPIEEKESYKWLQSYYTLNEIAQKIPNTLVIHVGDRENDIFECIAEAVNNDSPNKAHVIFRAAYNRNLTNSENETTKLFDLLRSSKEKCVINVKIPRKGGRKARTTRCSIKAVKTIIQSPRTAFKVDPKR